MRDVTDATQRVEQQVAEARRTAAIARFVSTAVDPAIDRSMLLGLLAEELADTIGNLCVVVEKHHDGSAVVTAV